jgi:hypothetical protein
MMYWWFTGSWEKKKQRSHRLKFIVKIINSRKITLAVLTNLTIPKRMSYSEWPLETINLDHRSESSKSVRSKNGSAVPQVVVKANGIWRLSGVKKRPKGILPRLLGGYILNTWTPFDQPQQRGISHPEKERKIVPFSMWDQLRRLISTFLVK